MSYKVIDLENYLIRQEQKKDYRVVEELVREAFWNVYRPGCQEHYVLHCFRSAKDYVPELALVMEVLLCKLWMRNSFLV